MQIARAHAASVLSRFLDPLGFWLVAFEHRASVTVGVVLSLASAFPLSRYARALYVQTARAHAASVLVRFVFWTQKGFLSHVFSHRASVTVGVVLLSASAFPLSRYARALVA